MSTEPEVVTEVVNTQTTTHTIRYSPEALAAKAGIVIEEGDTVQPLTGSPNGLEPWKAGHTQTAVKVTKTVIS